MNIKSILSKSSSILFASIVILSLALFAGDCRSDSEMEKPTETAKNKGNTQDQKSVLFSSLAGSWYPGDEKTLRNQLARFMEKANVTAKPNTIAMILPHAGYRFSGQAAMAAVKTLPEKKYRRVVVIGPSHRRPMENILSVPNVTHYGSPLGEVPLDVEFIAQLKKHDIFQTIPPVHQREHSVQIEVPLLQYCLKDFLLVPIVAGALDEETIRNAGAIIQSLIDEQTLVIASSDFTHYGPNYGYTPFVEKVPENIKKLDMAAYDLIAQRDVSGFLQYCGEKKATICGRIPIAIIMAMLGPDTKATLIQYDTSGNITSDFTNSVSYLSAVFAGKWLAQTELGLKTTQTLLSENDKKELLKLARYSLTYYLENKKLALPEQIPVTISPAMKQTRATFVTLEKHHRLRGCIGEIFPSQSLYKSVMINAVKAGVADRRFTPVTGVECAEITMEISVLTPPEEVPSYKDIVIGKHGVVLSKNGRSAVYLPQVAPEQGWDLPETLQHLSQKAGLSAEAWKQGARFMVFEAIVFSEKKE